MNNDIGMKLKALWLDWHVMDPSDSREVESWITDALHVMREIALFSVSIGRASRTLCEQQNHIIDAIEKARNIVGNDE